VTQFERASENSTSGVLTKALFLKDPAERTGTLGAKKAAANVGRRSKRESFMVPEQRKVVVVVSDENCTLKRVVSTFSLQFCSAKLATHVFLAPKWQRQPKTTWRNLLNNLKQSRELAQGVV
jgi:hypothetical protein